ncbi:predicted protein [Sclerotinia sclerotiorum 1980 UF-70]|uniref:Uncharacterized protein n=1 Tax=Sclerotinia sclerotiorum (strain ATCC 18683 / 1980 / Ss-1) TaxID=665079 RepID=A7EJE6_SCLS1|nr:predicted protein [Sclerotinia sclerotiorum 1980 UF-70]EDO02962.1 predicted protein [Sclerotinia sclerotiorum 1980 UF-70]
MESSQKRIRRIDEGAVATSLKTSEDSRGLMGRWKVFRKEDKKLGNLRALMCGQRPKD